MKAKLKLFVVAAVMMFTATATYGANESMMDLLKILRDKGTLTASEYELLVNASKADVIKNDTIPNSLRKQKAGRLKLKSKVIKVRW